MVASEQFVRCRWMLANQKHAKRKFAGIVLVSDSESWVGTGGDGSTGVMTDWEAFVANQRRMAGNEAKPTLISIDLQVRVYPR